MKAVIFDFDGLLFDSEPLWDETDRILLRKRGFVPSHELLVRRVGTGQKNTMELFKNEFHISEDTEALIEERIKIFEEEVVNKGIKLMPGAKDLIEVLYKKSIKLAIATGGYTNKRLGEILKSLGIGEYFSSYVGFDEFTKGKPNPEVFLVAAGKMKMAPHNCLVFEDAESGVLAAIAAGMKVYGVNKDKKILKKLQEAGANRVFRSLVEVSDKDIVKNYGIT